MTTLGRRADELAELSGGCDNLAVPLRIPHNNLGFGVRVLVRNMQLSQLFLLRHISLSTLPLTTLFLQLFTAMQNFLDGIARICVLKRGNVEPADFARELNFDVVRDTCL